MSIDELKEKAPQLQNWRYLQTNGDDLVKFLSSLADEVEALHQHHLDQLKKQSGRHDEDGASPVPYTEEQNDRPARLAAHHRQAIRERGNAPVIAPSTPRAHE